MPERLPLSVGMVLIERTSRARFQVVAFDSREAHIRRLVYRASMDGRGPMAWVVEDFVDAPDVTLRGNLEVLYEPLERVT
jgi:hypothetical protein